MNKRIQQALVWGISGLLMIEPCWGWGEVGHRVVGRIAAGLLTPAAQEKIAAILDVENTKLAVADAMADAAEWPDAVAREEYPQSIPWHFIDLGIKSNPSKDNPLWSSPDTAFARIVKYYATVKQGGSDDLEPGSDLKFLIHLLGDVHQPLHVATDQDRGANCLFIKFAKEQGGTSTRTKLHSAWDTLMLQDRLGTDDRMLAAHLLRDWGNLSKADQDALVAPQLAGDGSSEVRAWIVEAHEIAVSQVYGTLRPVPTQLETAAVASDCHDAAPQFKRRTWTLDDTDAENTSRLMERQLLKAGARLAMVLNATAH